MYGASRIPPGQERPGEEVSCEASVEEERRREGLGVPGVQPRSTSSAQEDQSRRMAGADEVQRGSRVGASWS